MVEPSRSPERRLLSVGLLAAVAPMLAAFAWALVTGGSECAAAEDGIALGRADYGFIAAILAGAGLVGLGIARERPDLRILAAAALSLGPLAENLAELAGYVPPVVLWKHPAMALLSALVCTVGAVGLVQRRAWARWLALAGAAAGVGSAGLNGIGTVLEQPCLHTCLFALSFGFSAAVGVALLGPSVRAEFERDRDAVWASPDPIAKRLRWMVLTQLVAIPMLVVYALIQPIVPATATAALVLAGVLGASAGLCLARKLVGALGLAIAGPALLVLTAVTAWQAQAAGGFPLLRIASYYACFWLPAGVVASATAIALIRPVLGLWRELDRG